MSSWLVISLHHLQLQIAWSEEFSKCLLSGSVFTILWQRGVSCEVLTCCCLWGFFVADIIKVCKVAKPLLCVSWSEAECRSHLKLIDSFSTLLDPRLVDVGVRLRVKVPVQFSVSFYPLLCTVSHSHGRPADVYGGSARDLPRIRGKKLLSMLLLGS